MSLTVDDAAALARDARYLSAVVPELVRNLQVKSGNQNANVNIVGTTPDYVPVRRFKLSAGRVFSAGDDQSSHASLDAAIARAEGSDATIYVIGQGRAIRSRDLQSLLTRFASISGGRAFFT